MVKDNDPCDVISSPPWSRSDVHAIKATFSLFLFATGRCLHEFVMHHEMH